MARHKIKFCENNFQFGTEEIIPILEEEMSNVRIEVHSCIGFCDDCANSPFALIDGEILQADTPEELLDEIKSYLE